MNLIDIRNAFDKADIAKQQFIDTMYEIHQQLFNYADYIGETDIAKIEIFDGSVIMTSRSAGIKMICNRSDKRIAPIEILNFREYEPTELNLILRIIEPGCVIFDIGANIGWYAMNVSKQIPNVSVYAFEPIPETYNYLKENIELNGINNIRTYNFGFSNVEDRILFYLPLGGSDAASAAYPPNGLEKDEIWCDVKTLDDFIHKSGLKVDFIKCDVEGAELLVFQGGSETIKDHLPIIFTEMLRKWSAKFNYHPNEIINFLNGFGYKCYVTDGDILKEFSTMNEYTIETNFFFLHYEKHNSIIKSLIG